MKEENYYVRDKTKRSFLNSLLNFRLKFTMDNLNHGAKITNNNLGINISKNL